MPAPRTHDADRPRWIFFAEYFRPPVAGWWAWRGWCASACFVVLWYYLATALIAQVNQNRLQSDQQSNMELARESRSDWYPLRTDGVVNPLWPWIAARFAGESDAAFFVAGKWVNVTLGCGALLLAARVLRRNVSPVALVCQSIWGTKRRAYFRQCRE